MHSWQYRKLYSWSPGIGDKTSNKSDLLVSVGVLNVISIEENQGQIRINLWLSLSWWDPRLS
jgi:hypothetical protein